MTTNATNELAPFTRVHKLGCIAEHGTPRALPPVLDPEPGRSYITRGRLAYVETGSAIGAPLFTSLAIEFARGYLTDNHPGLADKRVLIFDHIKRNTCLSELVKAVKERHPDFPSKRVEAVMNEGHPWLPEGTCLFDFLNSLDTLTGGPGCLIILIDPPGLRPKNPDRELFESNDVQNYLLEKGHGLIVMGARTCNPFSGRYALAEVIAIPNDETRAWLRVTGPGEDQDKSPSKRYAIEGGVWSFDGTIAPL